MPILGTGNHKAVLEPGYTLIEILAVLVILSIIGLLAFPRYERREERAYLKQIGNLVRADIRRVSEEAVCEKTEILMEFSGNGYRFDIGDTEINRVFDKFQFHWGAPFEEPEETEADALMKTFGLYGEEEAEIIYSNIEIYFNSEGIYPDMIAEWASQNFTGSLVMKSDGSLDWLLSSTH